MAILTLLRSAQPADCHDIYHVHEYAVQYTCRHGYDPVVLELWVAEYKGNIQGFFQLDLKEAQLDALYVHPFVHNQGLGTALLHKAETLAVKAGLSFIKLYASNNSVSFYRLNGYDSLGKAELRLNPSVTVGCELMRKNL